MKASIIQFLHISSYAYGDAQNIIITFVINLRKSQQQADRNKAKVLERLEKRKAKGGVKVSAKKQEQTMTQQECLEILRKCVEKSPIPGIQKRTLQNITKVCKIPIERC
jgi:hypothetical protein